MFRDKTTVIKLGGSMLDDIDALHHILLDIHFMETVGMRPVVVHGAGSRSKAERKRRGGQVAADAATSAPAAYFR